LFWRPVLASIGMPAGLARYGERARCSKRDSGNVGLAGQPCTTGAIE